MLLVTILSGIKNYLKYIALNNVHIYLNVYIEYFQIKILYHLTHSHYL